MGDDDGGAAVGQLLKGLLELGLRHGVQGGGGLVQNQHRRVLQKDPGDGDALLLPAGEQGAPLAHIGVESLGQGHDVVVDLRQPGRPGHLLLRGAGLAVADVLQNAGGEQEHVLLYHTHVLPQGLLGHLPDVAAVDADGAVRHVIEPGDQLAQGGLAASGWPHHGDGLAGADVEIHIVEHRQVILIGEGHMVHIDASLHPGEGDGVRCVLHGGLLPHQLQEPGKAGGAVGEQLREGGELADRVHEGGDIQAEGDQVHRVHPAPHDEEAAHGDHRHGEDAQEELHHRVEPAHGPVERPLGGLEAVIGHVELLQLRLLIGEGLGGLDAGEAGLDVGVDGGRPLLDLDGGILHGPAALPHHQEKHRDDAGDHQGQLPLNGEHNDQSAHYGDT